MCGIATNRWGFAESPPFELVATDRPGIFACGAFQAPKDIPETVVQASAAAAAAFNLLKDARGSKISATAYPEERDVSLEAPRIGVFVCHCGHNIASVVDVEALAAYARTLPFVVYADHFTFTCAGDSLENMRKVIEAESLNRIVVAACSPRTHEPLFRENLRQAGLNKYLFRMVNIRDQDAWVHQQEPEKATAKAKDLLRMGVARAAALEPLEEIPFQVTRRALVVGGGLAGMTAALAIADAGFPVCLVEKDEELGGMARRLHYTLEGHRMQPYLANLKHEMEYHPGIQVMTNTRVLDFSGHVGKFRSTVEGPRGRQEIDYGAVVIATGGVGISPHRVSLRPASPGAHPTGVGGQAGGGPRLPAGRAPGGDDPVRRLPRAGTPLLQPPVLRRRGEKRLKNQGTPPPGANFCLVPGYPHLWL